MKSKMNKVTVPFTPGGLSHCSPHLFVQDGIQYEAYVYKKGIAPITSKLTLSQRRELWRIHDALNKIEERKITKQFCGSVWHSFYFRLSPDKGYPNKKELGYHIVGYDDPKFWLDMSYESDYPESSFPKELKSGRKRNLPPYCVDQIWNLTATLPEYKEINDELEEINKQMRVICKGLSSQEKDYIFPYVSSFPEDRLEQLIGKRPKGA